MADAQIPLPSGSPQPTQIGVGLYHQPATTGITTASTVTQPAVDLTGFVPTINQDGTITYRKTTTGTFRKPIVTEKYYAYYGGSYGVTVPSTEWIDVPYTYESSEIVMNPQGFVLKETSFAPTWKEQWGGVGYHISYLAPFGTDWGTVKGIVLPETSYTHLKPLQTIVTKTYDYAAGQVTTQTREARTIWSNLTPEPHQYIQVGKNVIDVTMSNRPEGNYKSGYDIVTISPATKEGNRQVTYEVTPQFWEMMGKTSNVKIATLSTGEQLAIKQHLALETEMAKNPANIGTSITGGVIQMPTTTTLGREPVVNLWAVYGAQKAHLAWERQLAKDPLNVLLTTEGEVVQGKFFDTTGYEREWKPSGVLGSIRHDLDRWAYQFEVAPGYGGAVGLLSLEVAGFGRGVLNVVQFGGSLVTRPGETLTGVWGGIREDPMKNLVFPLTAMGVGMLNPAAGWAMWGVAGLGGELESPGSFGTTAGEIGTMYVGGRVIGWALPKGSLAVPKGELIGEVEIFGGGTKLASSSIGARIAERTPLPASEEVPFTVRYMQYKYDPGIFKLPVLRNFFRNEEVLVEASQNVQGDWAKVISDIQGRKAITVQPVGADYALKVNYDPFTKPDDYAFDVMARYGQIPWRIRAIEGESAFTRLASITGRRETVVERGLRETIESPTGYEIIKPEEGVKPVISQDAIRDVITGQPLKIEMTRGQVPDYFNEPSIKWAGGVYEESFGASVYKAGFKIGKQDVEGLFTTRAMADVLTYGTPETRLGIETSVELKQVRVPSEATFYPEVSSRGVMNMRWQAPVLKAGLGSGDMTVLGNEIVEMWSRPSYTKLVDVLPVEEFEVVRSVSGGLEPKPEVMLEEGGIIRQFGMRTSINVKPQPFSESLFFEGVSSQFKRIGARPTNIPESQMSSDAFALNFDRLRVKAEEIGWRTELTVASLKTLGNAQKPLLSVKENLAGAELNRFVLEEMLQRGRARQDFAKGLEQQRNVDLLNQEAYAEFERSGLPSVKIERTIARETFQPSIPVEAFGRVTKAPPILTTIPSVKGEIVTTSIGGLVSRAVPIGKTINVSRSVNITEPISVSRSLSESLSRSISRSVSQTVTVSQSISQNVTQTVTTGITTRLPIIPIVPFKTITWPFEEPGTKKKKKAYVVQVKRRGKWLESSGSLPRGLALKLGAEKAKGTLAATFRLKPSGLTEMPDIEYKPSSRIFRTYGIKKGKTFDLEDTFIQRASFRLGTAGELGEIQSASKSARALRMGSLGWL